MVLLFNVFLTPSPANSNLNLERGNLASYSKVDVTKYSLASLAVAYKWKRVILNIELGEEYIQEADELERYATDIFAGIDIQYSHRRNVTQQDWISTYSQINDEAILYLGNHDHIFLDSSRSTLEEIVQTVENSKLKHPTVAISHWPENIRWSKSGYIELSETFPRQLNTNYRVAPYGIEYTSTCIDSLIILNKALYKEWFLEGEWREGTVLPRTEGIGTYTLLNIKNSIGSTLPLQNIITPYKELFRHFDGYMHQNISNNVCPSLDIPPGFFESNIKIRYGYDDRKEGWVNINPKGENYYAYDKNGVDYMFTLEDIPLVWKDKITTTDINSDVVEEENIQHRLLKILNMIYSDERYNPYVDLEVQERVLQHYLAVYKNYQLD
jgi:hypothetical protein